jgi:hypothetical protein
VNIMLSIDRLLMRIVPLTATFQLQANTRHCRR